MHATLKEHIDPVYLEKALHFDASAGAASDKHTKLAEELANSGKPKKPMTILYGSNSGTCEALAQSLARVATARRYSVHVDPLDSAVDKIPKDQPVVLISSSYEGQPPDNAAHFMSWLANMKSSKQLEGVTYAVYGCGNRKFYLSKPFSPKFADKLQMIGSQRSTRSPNHSILHLR